MDVFGVHALMMGNWLFGKIKIGRKIGPLL